MALALVSLGFILVIAGVRVRINIAPTWPAQQAQATQVADDSVGRLLRMQAREGGPFPSRFEPARWEAFFAIDGPAFAATLPDLTPYAPVLMPLPQTEHYTLRMAPGSPVLPKPPPPPPAAPSGVRVNTMPSLIALAGIRSIDLPWSFPALPPDAMPSIAADPPRFLIRVDSGGGVLEATCLDPLDASLSRSLESWIRHLAFQPDDSLADRHGVVTIGTQQSPADGTDID
jgi:hypothetical protein